MSLPLTMVMSVQAKGPDPKEVDAVIERARPIEGVASVDSAGVK